MRNTADIKLLSFKTKRSPRRGKKHCGNSKARFRAACAVAGSTQLFPAGIVVSGKQAKSYLEGGVSAVGEVAEACWEPTETGLESGGGSPQLLRAPALSRAGQHHLEDMAGRESDESDSGLQGPSSGGNSSHRTASGSLSAWPGGRGEGTQCLLGTFSEPWARCAVQTRETLKYFKV